MFRKHFRFRRMVLGLAFAAVMVPVAPAGAASLSTFVDGGPAPASYTPIRTFTPSYLRYHHVGVPVTAAVAPEIRSENAQSVSTVTGLQADGLRYTAMAQRYKELQPRVAFSERSFGVPGPDPSLVPQLAVSTSSGFDWTDAGLGASTAFGAVLLLGLGIILVRRNQHSGLTSA